ncbi:MAG TPA: MFS transporter [Stellaceae bacterium]|nr:MFS transporter [Stellaceae bacterium]
MSGLSESVGLRNRWVRILGVAFVMHIIAFIDRNNVAMAIPAMRQSLGLSAASIGVAGGSLYISYIVMQVPAGRLAETWSAKKIILISAILWGLISLSTAFVHSETELLVNRLLMGLVEGGETITLIVLVRHWFVREERARALMVILISVPLSSVISNVISGVILSHFDWHWMFVLEAIPALGWAAVWQLAVSDHPGEARWLPGDLKVRLQEQLADEARAVKPLPGHWTHALWQPAVILLALGNLCFLTGNLGIVLWLPSVLRETGLSIGMVGVLSSLTYVGGALSMVFFSMTSDRMQERKWHTVVLCLGGGCFLALIPISGTGSVTLTVLCFAAVNALVYARYSIFWAMPSEILPASVVGVGLGLINGVGALGGFIGPSLFGYLRTHSHGYESALFAASAALMLSGLVTIPIPRAPARSTKDQDARSTRVA